MHTYCDSATDSQAVIADIRPAKINGKNLIIKKCIISNIYSPSD